MNLRRSPTRNRWERWRKEITGKRPYRCRACQWRGWQQIGILEDDVGSLKTRAEPPEPPNLRGTIFARPDPRHQFDVKDLDRFHAQAKDDD